MLNRQQPKRLMKSNLTLIGMPGAGKSTVGVILAKNLGLGFVDTDILIQEREQTTLQQILDERGHLALRSIEEAAILDLEVVNHVIATGGSAAYSDKAMQYLQRISTIVFLDVDFITVQSRIHNFTSRGIARAPEQSFADLFAERQVLYRRYAEISIDAGRFDQEEVAAQIIREIER